MLSSASSGVGRRSGCSVAVTGKGPMSAALLLLGSLVVFGQDAADEVVLDEIVARINQDVVTKTDLDNALRLLQVDLRGEIRDEGQFQEVFAQRKKQRLQELIETRLMMQRAEEMGIGAEAEQHVERYIQNLMDENGIPSLQVLDQALQQRGGNLQDFRENVRERMIVQEVQQAVVYGRITLLTPEVEAYYQEHQDDFANPPQVTLSEIAILYEDKSQREARDQAQKVLDLLKAGSAFDELAKEYSEGATSSRGGDIGPFQKGVLAENLERIVFDLDAGQTTGLIEHEWGIQIIKVTAKEISRVKPMDEVKSEIQMRLYEAKALPELEAFLKELVEESFIYVSPKYRDQFDLKEGI